MKIIQTGEDIGSDVHGEDAVVDCVYVYMHRAESDRASIVAVYGVIEEGKREGSTWDETSSSTNKVKKKLTGDTYIYIYSREDGELG